MRIRHQPCLLALLLFSSYANGQSGTPELNQSGLRKLPNCFVEPGYRAADTNQPIGNRAFRYILSQIYGTLAGGQPGGLVSAGSFDPVAGSFSINFAKELRIPKRAAPVPDSLYCNSNPEDLKPQANHSWFLSVTAGGSIISNNIGVLFNNSKFNTGTTVTGKLFIPLHNSIIMHGHDLDSIFKKKQAIEYQRWSDKKKAWSTIKSNFAQLNLEENSAKWDHEKLTVAALRKQAGAVKGELNKAIASGKETDPGSPVFAAIVSQRLKLADSLLGIESQADSLERDMRALQLKQDSLTFIRKIISDDENHTNTGNGNFANYGIQQYKKIDSIYDRQLDSVEMNASYTPYTLKWLAVIGSFNRNSYYTYFDSLAFSSRLSGNTLSVFNIGLEFSLIHYNPHAMHYFDLGLQRIRNNNIGDLSTSSLTTRVASSLNDTTQNLKSTYNVYTSAITWYEAWNPYIHYYLFLGKGQKQGFHLNPQAEFRNTGQNPVNLALGYIFSFKNSKDNSVLNVEAYVKFQDIFKALPSQPSGFYNRNTIGLLFGIPINFPTIK